jgi:hypothetical protein
MRGPTWKSGDEDSSPIGKLMTGVDSSGCVEVKWSSGTVMKCCAGKDDCFELVTAIDCGDIIEAEWSLDIDGGWLKIKGINNFVKISDTAKGISYFERLKIDDVLDEWVDWRSHVEVEKKILQGLLDAADPLVKEEISSESGSDLEESELSDSVDPSLERVQNKVLLELLSDRTKTSQVAGMLTPPPLQRNGLTSSQSLAFLSWLGGSTMAGILQPIMLHL